MKTSENTILITGGGSGIGFETARLLSDLGNTVILVGRNKEKLEAAAGQLRNVHYIATDVTNEQEVNKLVDTVYKTFPRLNVLMNNAGRAVIHDVSNSPEGAVIAREEMDTNYFAVLSLTNKLLPLLRSQSEPAIINVSSVVAVESYYNSEEVDRQITPDLRVEALKDMIGDEISNALNSLDVDFRTVIILCDLEGFKYDEMAKILDIPIGTVRSRLHRARNLLKEKLSEYAKQMGYKTA